MSADRSRATPAADRPPAGDWDEPALSPLADWDPEWTDQYVRMSLNPWTNGILPRKTIELVCVALNAACTNLQPSGTRAHIRAALQAGASRDEILAVLKMAAMLSIHSCSLGAPLLLEEAQAAGVQPDGPEESVATPASDAMRAMGQWNAAWDPFFALDPGWTDDFMAAALGIYAGGVLTAKDVELLSIAFDASVTHMYAPGTRRHITGALAAGASVAEIMEVLKVCVAFGGEALQLGVPILAAELERIEK